MGTRLLAQVVIASAVLGIACGRVGLLPAPDSGTHSSSLGGAGGSSSGSAGDSGAGGTRDGGPGGKSNSGGAGGFVIPIPDGGLSFIFGDGGLLAGILDAPRDSLLGQVICGPEAKLGAPCSSTGVPGCILPSLGGVCACLNGTYVCPLGSGGPQACPPGAGTGSRCLSPLSTCIGGSANGCICGAGTYTCF